MVAVSSVGISRSGLDHRGQAALQRPGAFVSQRKYRGVHPVNNEANEEMPFTQDAKSADKALPLAGGLDGNSVAETRELLDSIGETAKRLGEAHSSFDVLLTVVGC